MTQRPPKLRPLIISAPFGNYVQPQGATPTLGTFTAAARRGRLWRIVRTVRYSPVTGAWVNRIGLRNPGMPWLVERVEAGRINVSNKIVSIHGFRDEDWATLLEQIARIRPLAVELNMSCPNVGEIDCPPNLFADAVATGVATIVKLPPIHYEALAQRAIESGVWAFHCTNTLPVPRGGLSGSPLKPIALSVVRFMRQTYGQGVTLIGGGGIRRPPDIDDYVAAGANHVALGTVTMNPLLLLTHRPLRLLIERAQAKLG